MNLNKVLLIGRLAADPESRSTPSGQVVATLRVATNRVWNDTSGAKQEQTEFHTVVVWGKQAENAQKYLLKGQMVSIEGRLQTRSWQAQDGAKRYSTEIVAENVQFGPKAQGGGMSAPAPSAYTASAPKFNASQPKASAPSAGGGQLKDDDIPIINEDFPVANPTAIHNDIEEVEIDLKDIPF